MYKSPALAGLLLLLPACYAADPGAAAQQLTPSRAVAANDQAVRLATDAAPGATPATHTNQHGATSMEADKQEEAAQLRASFESCVARSGGVTPDMHDCIAVEAGYQDGRLASAYEALRATLPPAEGQALESQQNAWITERRKGCAGNAAEEGQGQRLEADGCALEMTARRAAQLEARLQRR